MKPKSDILVVGAGYVGLATAVFLADRSYPVTVVEKNDELVRSLRRGAIPFREPELARRLRRVLRAGRISFVPPEPEPYRQADLIFVAIDSVDREIHRMRMNSFHRMAEWIGSARRRRPATVILKSTNAYGFASQFRRLLDKSPYGKDVRVIVNPEFLREGFAYDDTARPWRIILGADDKRHLAPLKKVYKVAYGPSIPVVETDCRSAEIIKLAANVYLAHRLSFIHEMADFARQEHLDIGPIKEGIGLDPRIGLDYFEPGLGFGGSCLPKDCVMINSPDSRADFVFQSARTALAVNDRLLDHMVASLKERLGTMKGKKIAILGITFKADLDDTRGSRAVQLALRLKKAGARLGVYDPYMTNHERTPEGGIALEKTLEDAVDKASAVVIGTAHKRFKRLKPSILKAHVQRKVVCDFYNILNRTTWTKAGFTVI